MIFSRVRLGVSRLIMACRNPCKAQDARKMVLGSAPQATAPSVEVLHVDIANKVSITEFAKRAASELDRIDGVLLNAGIDANVFEMADGDESTLGFNVVSTFLWAVALLPKLKEAQANSTHSHG